MSEGLYLSALLAGLLGGVHCVGMCGGVVGAIGLSLGGAQGGLRSLPLLLAYNIGRIASYAVAGALLGGVGLLGANLLAINQAQQWLALLAGGVMILLGLYLGGWWFGLSAVERLGGSLWRRLEPFARRLLPVRNSGQALLLGGLWGWLPCGLVYSALIMALGSGGPLEGGLLLVLFGLGTLPNLLLMGLFARRLAMWVRKLWLRRVAGGVIVLFGVVGAGRALQQLANSVG